MKSTAIVALAVAVVLLAGCGESRPPPARPQDVAMQRTAAAGRLAFTMHRPSEAVAQYRLALQRAEAGDDAAAIGDYGYDLAVAELAANEPNQALLAARKTQIELSRRGLGAFPALILVEATALYRLGKEEEADRLAKVVEAGGDPSAAAAASFLRGLIADQTGNRAELAAALAHLQHPANHEQSADAFELAARRELRDGDFTRAADEAARAADLRRNDLDYRGMARALALQGAAEADRGNARNAADLYIRAARSAAAEGDSATARAWSKRALELATTPELRQLAEQTLAGLSSSPHAPSR
ncbi:MAG: hypothetical protein ACREFJ_13910 [Acetobacteraceae bacterium]